MQLRTSAMNVNVEARTVKLVRVQSMRELTSDQGQERERVNNFIMAIIPAAMCCDRWYCLIILIAFA